MDSNLIAGEKVIYKAAKSWTANWLGLLLGVVLLPVKGLGLIILVPIIIDKLTTELAITDKRIIAKMGLLSRRTIELKIERIESMQVSQGVFGRILNYGDLIISGAGNPQAPIKGISNPLAFRTQLAQLTDKF